MNPTSTKVQLGWLWPAVALLLAAMACNAPRLFSDNQQPTLTSQPLHLQGQLQPGGSIESAEGLILRAQPNSISDPIAVEIETTDPPTDEHPLSQNVLPSGSFLRISASETTSTPSHAPFTLSLLVDPAEVDTEHLALAVLVPGEEIHYRAECLVDDCPEISPRDTWFPLSGVYRSESSRFETTLPVLVKEGLTVVLVQSLDYSSPPIPSGQSLRPRISFINNGLCSTGNILGGILCPLLEPVRAADNQQNQNTGFRAYCRQFGSSQFSCGNGEEEAVENEVSERHQELQGIGFADPYLKTDSNSDYELEIRPFFQGTSPINELATCEAANGGVVYGSYNHITQTFIVCIGDDGVIGITRATARHEYFHAVQYGYPEFRSSFREGWVVEGTASASEHSLYSFQRDTGRPLHEIDISLKESVDFVAYRAQDFWVS
ncbi:MAG: hypothetical protein R3300_22265, partial [Candidatus Promineifilaceae bacterium]|nr:hypothetical protein [Candidatus Promineifilaceae bacterium]